MNDISLFNVERSGAAILRQQGSERSRLFVGQIASSLFLLLFAGLFYIVYRDYVSVEWGYTGLRFSELSGYEILAIALAIALQGWVMPQRIGTPSSVVLWMLTTLIFVPTMIITLMIGEREPSLYYGELAALTAVMVTASVFCRRSKIPQNSPQPPDRFFIIIASIFTIISLLLFYLYNEIMSFASIEDVYFQRFAASEIGAGSIMGYIRTHYVYVFSSILLCAGFAQRRLWFLIPLGFSGFVITYLIDASKIAFIIPLMVVAFFAVYRFAQGRVWTLNAGLAFLTLGCGALVNYASGAKLIADLVLFRSIAIPAQTFAQYADVFSARGYTYWSNVRGISSIVPPPQNFASDPFWPVLGEIVGGEFFGLDSRVNLNANLFVGEGIAAAGSVGVIVIGLIMIAWLRVFDFVARGWNERFVMLICVPLAMSITNAHLSTFLLSFGGIFWIVLMFFYKPSPHRS